MLFTIGHSSHTIEEFINILKKFDIDYLCDVRSTPYSKFMPLYNKENLKKNLEGVNIKYIFLGKELGARRTEQEVLTDGVVDFNKLSNDETFLKGINRIIKGLEQYNLVIMCTEKNPIDCHRTILIAKKFSEMGIEVNHINFDGNLISQKEIEVKLIENYFPDRNQINIFEINNEIDYLKEAYRLAGKAIGYKGDDNK